MASTAEADVDVTFGDFQTGPNGPGISSNAFAVPST
jgi:hypothetical protein